VTSGIVSTKQFQSKIQNAEPPVSSPVLLNNKRTLTKQQQRPTTDHNDTTQDDDHAVLKSRTNRMTRRRPKSGSKVAVVAAAARDVNEVSSSSNSGLTTEEKEEVVRQFVRQFLQENPEVALDDGLMSSLSCMASQLVQQSFRLNSSAEQGSIQAVENDLMGGGDKVGSDTKPI
jgi:hypothetical protein